MTRLKLLLGVLISLILGVIISLELDTPVAKDIAHIQGAVTICANKGLQAFSTDYNSVTCSNGKVYKLEKNI
jgi:hypothetical protein